MLPIHCKVWIASSLTRSPGVRGLQLYPHSACESFVNYTEDQLRLFFWKEILPTAFSATKSCITTTSPILYIHKTVYHGVFKVPFSSSNKVKNKILTPRGKTRF